MAIHKTEKIWHNGKLINWDEATLHVMSHVVHYGSSVFEGIRCYELPTGPAIFRAVEHMQRLVDSAKVYRMDIPFTRDELVRAMVETIAHNGAWPCYIRPVVFRGYGDAGDEWRRADQAGARATARAQGNAGHRLRRRRRLCTRRRGSGPAKTVSSRTAGRRRRRSAAPRGIPAWIKCGYNKAGATEGVSRTGVGPRDR